MTQPTTIEWTDRTWNPVRGCTAYSAGCANCYARRFAERWRGTVGHPYERGFDLRLVPDRMYAPLKLKKPQRIFVNSMGDLFHGDVPPSYIRQVFVNMVEAYWHTFQILTKRSERMAAMRDELLWAENIWMGVSVETSDYLNRVDHLRAVPAVVRFISVEPLLGRIASLPREGIDWVIVGGETGPRHRPMNEQWALEILGQCQTAGVPFFFKQGAGRSAKAAPQTLAGKMWREFPKPRNAK